MLNKLRQEFKKLASPDKASGFSRFFKTGKGQYAHGDIFLGLSVPQTRSLVKAYSSKLGLKDLSELLHSRFHEERLCALLIMVQHFQKGDEKQQQAVVKLYLKNLKAVNNWDLVDLSADKILGASLCEQKDRSLLYNFAKSKDLWEKRIAIISTFYFIKQHEFKDTLAICKLLLADEHDLIHKACGWMLRELGKRDEKMLEGFLQKHYDQLPRTTLRYAIEKFSEKKRKRYLLGSF